LKNNERTIHNDRSFVCLDNSRTVWMYPTRSSDQSETVLPTSESVEAILAKADAIGSLYYEISMTIDIICSTYSFLDIPDSMVSVS